MRLMRWGRVLVMLAGASGSAWAQSMPAPGPCDTGGNRNGECRLHLSISSVIQATRRLRVLPGSDLVLAPAHGSLTPADYDAGWFDAAGQLTVFASSNAPWRVTTQAAAATLSGGCGTAASNIRWGLTPGDRVTPVGTAPVTLMSGVRYTESQSVSLYLRVAIAWASDAPATEAGCALPMTFTITAP